MVENEAMKEAAMGEERDAAAPAEEPGAEASEAAAQIAKEPDAASRARLVLVRSGVEADQAFEFASPAVIGRFDPAVGPVDVDLGAIDEGRYVSRRHARIAYEQGVWKITDLGSSNGTYVLRGDFERVDEAELVDGLQIALGNARFVFRLVPGDGGSCSEREDTPSPDASATD